MQGINFIAIDLKTATSKRASICEVGICIVHNGEVAETRSWLVRPQGNMYSYWNMQLNKIRPSDTINSPKFHEVWTDICEYLKDIPVLVAHDANFDIDCIRRSLELYGMEKPDITYYCSLRAANKLYNFGCNSLNYLCDQFKIPYVQHRRAGEDAEMCAHLFLKEIKDSQLHKLEEMDYCNGKL